MAHKPKTTRNAQGGGKDKADKQAVAAIPTAPAAEPDSKSETTVFVRGLPSSASATELETLFADLGPVKKCFVVGSPRGKSLGQSLPAGAGAATAVLPCAGYGYVNFALADDAQSAVAKSGTMKFGESVLTVLHSRKRDSLETRTKRKRALAQAELEQRSNEKGKEGDAETEQPVSRKMAKIAASSTTRNPQPNDSAAPPEETNKERILPKKPNQKQNQKFGNAKFQKDTSVEDSATIATSSTTSKTTAQNDKWGKSKSAASKWAPKGPVTTSNTSSMTSRLIVRNLSFRCNESILRKLFECYGQVTQCLMPRKTEPDGLYRGFGTVQFERREDAATALAAMNETSICGRPVAVDWCFPQSEYLATDESVARKKAATEQKSKPEGSAGAPAAVPLAHVPRNPRDAPACVSSNSVPEDGGDVTPAQPTERAAPRRIAVEEGTTVFVRGVPSDCDTEETLKAAFDRFGEIVSCSLTRDRVTGLARGSAFVCFTTCEAADAAIDAAASIVPVREDALSTAGQSQHMQQQHSIMVPEMPRSVASAPMISGRLLRVDLALARADAPVRCMGGFSSESAASHHDDSAPPTTAAQELKIKKIKRKDRPNRKAAAVARGGKAPVPAARPLKPKGEMKRK